MYNIDKHIALHKHSYLDLAQAGSEPTGHDKVCHLLKSISAPSLAQPKITVYANPNMVEDFEATVNYLKQFVFSYPMSSRHTVAAVAGRKIGPEMIMDSQGNTAELHWHQPEEWDLLSSELKDIIHAHWCWTSQGWGEWQNPWQECSHQE